MDALSDLHLRLSVRGVGGHICGLPQRQRRLGHHEEGRDLRLLPLGVEVVHGRHELGRDEGIGQVGTLARIDQSEPRCLLGVESPPTTRLDARGAHLDGKLVSQ